MQSAFRLTIISDNEAGFPYKVEHGLSILIESEPEGPVILFDTGRGDVFWKNAARLDIDLTALDFIVLSHGHYDHSGNLAELLHRSPRAKLALHPGALKPRFSIHESPREIGMPADAVAAVGELPPQRLIHCREPLELIPGLRISGEIPRINDFEDTGGPFYLDSDGREPDPIPDDLALALTVGEEWHLITGCAHAGLVNTIEYFRGQSGGVFPSSVTGGFHLAHAGEERMGRTYEYFNDYPEITLAPLHCSGDAIELFEENLTNSILRLRAGDVLDLK